jgi:hypothetical protein
MSAGYAEAGLQVKKYKVKDIQAGRILTIRCENEEGQATPSSKYTLIIGDKTIEGAVDENGLIKQKISSDAEGGTLKIEGEEIKLTFIKFEPVDTIKGAQQRLKNLGYNPGPCDGDLGLMTREALMRFQNDNAPLTADGEYGPETQEMLKKIYRS